MSSKLLKITFKIFACFDLKKKWIYFEPFILVPELLHQSNPAQANQELHTA